MTDKNIKTWRNLKKNFKMKFYIYINEAMPDWIDFSHFTPWVMGFNEFNNFFYFLKLFYLIL
jgi:hypothetical protein